MLPVAVAMILPKLEAFSDVTGFPRLVWLITLNTSARASSRQRSRSWETPLKERSKLITPGGRTVSRVFIGSKRVQSRGCGIDPLIRPWMVHQYWAESGSDDP